MEVINQLNDLTLDKVVDYVDNFRFVVGETPLSSLEFLVGIHVMYLVVLYALKAYMEDRKTPTWVKPFSFVHNVFMSSLSLVMLVGVIVGALQDGRFDSFDDFACHPKKEYTGLLPFTVYIFYVSKALEFIDTYLLVLRKKQVIWLHKIHHLTTMKMVWVAIQTELPSDIICAGLNCFVHVVMYAYFAYPVGFLRSSITSLQLAQFVAAGGTVVYAFYMRTMTENPCRGTYAAELHGIVMYIIYFALFTNFFVQQYLSKKKARAAKKAASKKAQ